jgi:hypothetical protein
VVLTAQ